MSTLTPPAPPIPTVIIGTVPPETPTAEFVTVKYSPAQDGTYTAATTQTISSSEAFAAYSSALSLYSKSTATATGSSPNPTTSTSDTPTATAARSSTSSSVTPSPPTFSTGTPNSPTTTNPSSSATSTSSGTSAPLSTNPAAINSSGHGLSNGTVAGIVIGVAVGLALITFLATFLAMRRRRGSGVKNNRGVLDTGSGQHYQDSEPKGPSMIETASGSTSFENFLPQSADDKTVQNNVKTTLDHIELHVENFYQNASASGARSADAELATFNSPYLPSSLAALLPQTNNRVLLIKHALAHFITSCISATASPDWSLLPEDFVLLPSAIRAANSSKSTKPGFGQSMSRWRVLTAYLRPNPLDDTSYIAQRDHQINEMVQVFSRAFAPWQNPKYKDKERVESLSAILKEAAGLGIWMFSQPSELQFQWPKHSEVGSNKVAVTPALVKLTDERGQSLSQPQVMIKIAAQKV